MPVFSFHTSGKTTFGILLLLIFLSSCKRQGIDKNCCTSPPVVYYSETAYLGIPNIFTPDGDGANDLLYPIDSGITSFEFNVTDKFGKILFSANSPNFFWDGTHEGKTLNGVYDYQLKATTNSSASIERSGSLCIVSNYKGKCLQNSSSCVFDLQWTGTTFTSPVTDPYKPCP